MLRLKTFHIEHGSYSGLHYVFYKNNRTKLGICINVRMTNKMHTYVCIGTCVESKSVLKSATRWVQYYNRHFNTRMYITLTERGSPYRYSTHGGSTNVRFSPLAKPSAPKKWSAWLPNRPNKYKQKYLLPHNLQLWAQ